MKLPILFVCCALCFCSCSKSGTPKDEAGARAQTADTPAAADSDKDGTFWELPSKADMKVATDPWPPKAGAAILKVEVDIDDDDQKFSGAIAYRISSTEQSAADWQPLPKVREDADKTVHFETPVTLATGTCYIQFRVKGAGEAAFKQDHLDLTDWKIEVK